MTIDIWIVLLVVLGLICLPFVAGLAGAGWSLGKIWSARRALRWRLEDIDTEERSDDAQEVREEDREEERTRSE